MNRSCLQRSLAKATFAIALGLIAIVGQSYAQSREAGGWIATIETCLEAMQQASFEPFEAWPVVETIQPDCANCKGKAVTYLNETSGTKFVLDIRSRGDQQAMSCRSDSSPYEFFAADTTGAEIRSWVDRQITNRRFFVLKAADAETHLLAICPREGRSAELSISIVNQYGEGFVMWNYPEDRTPCQLLLS